MLPGAARLAKLPAEPSAEAKRRLLVVNWCEQHNCNARLTARHFGRFQGVAGFGQTNRP